MNSHAFRVLTTMFRRELATVVRTPGYGLLSVGLLVVLFGFVTIGGGGQTGYIPAIVDLVVPVELLVPLVAVLLGYRALHTDATSGELAVIRTYPVSAPAYVIGIVLARLLALVVMVGIPMTLVGVYVWASASPETGIFATHRGVDSPIVFIRFITLAVCLGVPYVLFAAAVSALARSKRGAYALAVVVLVGGVIGGDLLILRSLTVDMSANTLPTLLGMTPNTAFRGLVFEYVIGVARSAEGRFVNPIAAVGGLVGWSLLGVIAAIGVLTTDRQLDRFFEQLRATIRR